MKLVDEWRDSWKWLSVQLAAIASLLGGALIAVLPNLLVWVAELPTSERIGAATIVMLLTLGLPWLARVLKQDKLDAGK